MDDAKGGDRAEWRRTNSNLEEGRVDEDALDNEKIGKTRRGMK